MYTDKNVKLINYLIALIPLSLILGNLIVNINIVLICVVGILICGTETFKIKKNYEILITFFFIYIIIVTATNNIPKFDLNPKYQENFFKSIFNLRFLLLFLVINTLIKKDNLAASVLLKLRILEAEIIIPDLLTPGTKDNI